MCPASSLCCSLLQESEPPKGKDELDISLELVGVCAVCVSNFVVRLSTCQKWPTLIYISNQSCSVAAQRGFLQPSNALTCVSLILECSCQ